MVKTSTKNNCRAIIIIAIIATGIAVITWLCLRIYNDGTVRRIPNSATVKTKPASEDLGKSKHRKYTPRRRHGNRLKIDRTDKIDPLRLPDWVLREVEYEKSLASSTEKVIARLRAYLESEDFKSLSADRQKAFHMRHALDSGDKDMAMAIARELMDSDDIAVRESSLRTFEWLGVDAMPELAEMAMDDDAQIAAEAMKKFIETIEEVPEEVERAELIKQMIPTLTTTEEVDSLLMELTRMETKTAIQTVVDVIENGTQLSEASAKDMYHHLTGGEDYEGIDQAEVILERMLRLQAGESYTKVMIETGGEVSETARAIYEQTDGTMKLPDGTTPLWTPQNAETAPLNQGVKQ